MATSDARPVPIKNTAFRAYFGIFKNDGTLITGATGLDSEVSKDGATFTDCTNEATEVATSSGVYYIDLTNTEMNADSVVLLVKSTSTGAVPVILALYPEETGDINVDVTAFGGSSLTQSGGRPEVNATHIDGVSATNLRRAFEGMTVVTVGSGSTSTAIATGLTEATNDHYKNKPLYFITGALAGQIVEITAYNGSTKVLTVTATPTGESPAQNDIALIA